MKQKQTFKKGDKVRTNLEYFTNVFSDDENIFIVEALISDDKGKPMWLCKPEKILWRQPCHFYPDQIEHINNIKNQK